MTKEDKIKEAWGVHYSSDIDENGYRTYTEFQAIHIKQWVGNFWKKGFNEVLKIHWVRPKSLRGIENNNGWIKIESEEDLPKNNGSYFTKTNYCKETIERDYPIFTKSMSIEDERKWWLENITHYQPIVKPNNPLY